MRKYETQNPENIYIYEIICLRSRAASFRCGSDNKNKLKGSSKTHVEIIEFEEYSICSFGGEYQKECDKYVNMLQNLLITISIFKKYAKMHYHLLMKDNVIYIIIYMKFEAYLGNNILGEQNCLPFRIIL